VLPYKHFNKLSTSISTTANASSISKQVLKVFLIGHAHFSEQYYSHFLGEECHKILLTSVVGHHTQFLCAHILSTKLSASITSGFAEQDMTFERLKCKQGLAGL